MSKRTGDRAKFNRESKKRKNRRRRVQELRIALKSKVINPVAENPAHGEKQNVNSRLRQLAGDAKNDATAFEIVVYPQRQGEEL